MSAPRRAKAVAHHVLRRNAVSHCAYLNTRLARELLRNGTSRIDWLTHNNFPLWTVRFEVRRSRLRVHYHIVAVGN